MRSYLFLTTIFAVLPPVGGALAQSHCAAPASQAFIGHALPSDSAASEPRIPLAAPLTVSGATPQVISPPVATPRAQASVPTPVRVAAVDQPPLPRALPDDLTRIPALTHFTKAGATLSDLGDAHGLHSIFAEHGSQFMILELTPDRQATVAGLITEISVSQLQALAPGALVQLRSAHGLQGYFLRNGKSFQVLYVPPDNKAVIPGVMWDASGANLTREQGASIPGAIPTGVLGDGAQATASTADPGSPPSTGAKPVPVSFSQAASVTTYGTVGNENAADLWMLVDPQCSYSIRAMQGLQPAVASGRIHLHVVPLSFLDGEDSGLSTKRALQLVSAPAGEIVADWESGQGPTKAADDAAAKLQANMEAAAALEVKGTPTFFWRRADGRLGRFDGLPPDFDNFLSKLGT